MKKGFIAMVLFCFSAGAHAQHIEASVHGGYGTTWMFNQNVSDQGEELDYKVSFGPVAGISGGYFLASGLGLTIGLDYALDVQKYSGKSAPYTYDFTDKLQYLEVPLMLRKYTQSGLYLEIGPKVSFLMAAKEKAEGMPAPLRSEYTTIDGYRKVQASAVIGIGGHFAVAKHLYLNAGLRLAYAFTDATQEFSNAELLKRATEGSISVGTFYAHISQQGDFSYKRTNLATGHIIVGLSYEIPAKKKVVKPAAEERQGE